MTLTADASVVTKWFVKEEGSKEARGLLAHRIHLYAPDILLAEFANTIWKKVHRREIADPRRYFDELANVPDIVTLHRGDALIDRVARCRTFPQLAPQSRTRQQDGGARRQLRGGIRSLLASWVRARDEYPACSCCQSRPTA